MSKITKPLLLLILPCSVFANNWLFCPTSGSLKFLQSAVTKHVSNVTMKQNYKITYWDMNQNKQENIVDCLEVNTSGSVSNDSSNISWVQKVNNSIPYTPDYMSATLYPQPNSPKDQVPSALKIGINGLLSITINSIQYSCPNVTIGMGHFGFNDDNFWVVFNNTTDNAHSINCYDENNNLVPVYPIPPNATGTYDGRGTQDYVIQFSLEPDTSLWNNLFSGIYAPGHA